MEKPHRGDPDASSTSAPSSLLARWHAAVAARSGRWVSASEPWHTTGLGSLGKPEDDDLSSPALSTSSSSSMLSSSSSSSAAASSPLLSAPSRAAAFVVRAARRLGPRLRRVVLVVVVVLVLSGGLVRLRGHGSDSLGGFSWNTLSQPLQPEFAEVCASLPAVAGAPGAADATTPTAHANTAAMAPHIPAKIWQVYFDLKPNALSQSYLASWIVGSPAYAYSILDATNALAFVARLAAMARDGSWRAPLYPIAEQEQEQQQAAGKRDGSDLAASDADGAAAATPPPPAATESDLGFARDAVELYTAMPRWVLRADFMRYLVLALEGGVYSDVDTTLVRPVRAWVPAALRNATRLVVGLEADSSPPVKGTTYEVQFCQWTLASAPGHPALWTMLARILADLRGLPAGRVPSSLSGKKGKLSNDDVLAITGPAAWTEVVFAHLNQVAGDGVGRERITWHTLTGMTEPRLFGDTLVLPINGFATGVPHSKASRSNTKDTLIRHEFQGTWRGDKR